MIPPPPRSTLTDTLFPSTTLFRSGSIFAKNGIRRRISTSWSILMAASFSPSLLLVLCLLRPGGRCPPLFGGHHHLESRIAPAQLVIAALLHRSEEHTSELQSLMRISYAVFCLTKKNTHKRKH